MGKTVLSLRCLYPTAVICLAALMAAAANKAAAQSPASPDKAAQDPSPWTVSGSFRARFESIDGQARAGFNSSDELISTRARLAAEYDAGTLRFGGELFDSRAFLANSGTPLSTGEVNTLELVQAYAAADFKSPWGAGSKATVEVGRFMLNLGSRRLVAADDYRNTTNGSTGIRLDGQLASGASATLIYVLPQLRRPSDFASLDNGDVQLDHETDDLRLYGGILTVPAGPGKAAIQASYFGLEERDQPSLATRDRKLHTLGLRYFREPAAGAYDFDVEGFTQSGTISEGLASAAAALDVSAYYLHAEAGYRWTGGWKPRLAFEYDIASGDKPGGKFNRFDTLFGMRRAEIAPSGLYNAVGRANLASPGVRLELEPGGRWDAFIAWRGLWLASDTDSFSTTGVRDSSGRSGDFAGNQLDARFRYWLAPKTLRFETNLVYLAKGEFLKSAPNAPPGKDTIYAAFDLTAMF